MRSSDHKKIFSDIERSLEREMQEIIQDINTEVIRTTPKRTGRAQRGWRVRGRYTLGGNSTVLENMVPYIGILDQGSSRQAPGGIVDPSVRKLLNRRRKRI